MKECDTIEDFLEFHKKSKCETLNVVKVSAHDYAPYTVRKCMLDYVQDFLDRDDKTANLRDLYMFIFEHYICLVSKPDYVVSEFSIFKVLLREYSLLRIYVGRRSKLSKHPDIIAEGDLFNKDSYGSELDCIPVTTGSMNELPQFLSEYDDKKNLIVVVEDESGCGDFAIYEEEKGWVREISYEVVKDLFKGFPNKTGEKPQIDSFEQEENLIAMFNHVSAIPESVRKMLKFSSYAGDIRDTVNYRVSADCVSPTTTVLSIAYARFFVPTYSLGIFKLVRTRDPDEPSYKLFILGPEEWVECKLSDYINNPEPHIVGAPHLVYMRNIVYVVDKDCTGVGNDQVFFLDAHDMSWDRVPPDWVLRYFSANLPGLKLPKSKKGVKTFGKMKTPVTGEFFDTEALVEIDENEEVDTVKTVLSEREKTYGNFSDLSEFNNELIKRFENKMGHPLSELNPEVSIGLFMVLHKLSRIVNNPNHKDSWVDIAGYATLVSGSLEG